MEKRQAQLQELGRSTYLFSENNKFKRSGGREGDLFGVRKAENSLPNQTHQRLREVHGTWKP